MGSRGEVLTVSLAFRGHPCWACASDLSSLQIPVALRSSRASISPVKKVRTPRQVPWIRAYAGTPILTHPITMRNGPVVCARLRAESQWAPSSLVWLLFFPSISHPLNTFWKFRHAAHH